MSQAMNTAMSGMSAGQQQITVVSDNIANLNTTAYKESQANFQDIWYETRSPGTSGYGNRGGTNVMQIGVGTMLSSISKNFDPSTINTTGRTTDMAIQGKGFFTLIDEEGSIYYSRAGNFTLDPTGWLTAPNGMKVIGTNVSVSYNSSSAPVKIPPAIEAIPTPRDAATLAGKYVNDLNGAKITSGDFTITATINNTNVPVTINIPDPSTITMQGLATIITNTLAANGVDASCAVVDGAFKFTIDDPSGQTTDLDFTAGSSSFVQATFISNTPKIPGPPDSYETNPLDYTVQIKPISDVRNMLAFRAFTVSDNGIIEATYSNGDRITVYTDPNDGTKRFKYTMSNSTEILGPKDCTSDPNILVPENLQMQFANITNPEGLIATGSNLFVKGPNTGDIIYSHAQGNGVGPVKTGGLESSNVDLARQFSNMILAQRAIEANSRVFDTANNVLQTLVYLGRG